MMQFASFVITLKYLKAFVALPTTSNVSTCRFISNQNFNLPPCRATKWSLTRSFKFIGDSSAYFAYSIVYTGRFKICEARGIHFLIKNIKYSSYEYDPCIGKSMEL